MATNPPTQPGSTGTSGNEINITEKMKALQSAAIAVSKQLSSNIRNDIIGNPNLNIGEDLFFDKSTGKQKPFYEVLHICQQICAEFGINRGLLNSDVYEKIQKDICNFKEIVTAYKVLYVIKNISSLPPNAYNKNEFSKYFGVGPVTEEIKYAWMDETNPTLYGLSYGRQHNRRRRKRKQH